MGKRQELKCNIKWIPCESEEQREQCLKTMVEFLCGVLSPGIRELRDAVASSREAIAKADRLLATPLKFDSEEDAIKARIAELEAELTRLKNCEADH